jgi:uncharacterized protein YbaP (TraB family)
VLAFAAGAIATAASAAPALWKVSDGDSSIWLFGSIHILDAGVQWRTPAFDAALADADEIYFELVLNGETMTELAALAAEKGYLPQGQTLADVLSPDQDQRLDKALSKLGVPRALVEGMQPWMAGLIVSSFALQKSGQAGDAQFDSGIESQIQAETPDDRERGLETPKEQLSFLSMGTPEEQAIALMDTIDQLDASSAAFGGIIDAWLAGDVDAIQNEIVTTVGPVESEQYKLLLSDRNERWVTTLTKLLADNVDAMIIVGAGHLAGPAGVPALLETADFTVERVD